MKERLRNRIDLLEATGHRLTWVSLQPDEPSAYRVALWKGDQQIVVELRSDEGTADEQAAAMAGRLLDVSPSSWHVVFRSRPLRDASPTKAKP